MGCAGNDLHHWSWSAAELQNEIFTDPQIPVCDEGDDRTNAQEEGCIGRSVDPVLGSMYGTGSYGRNGKYSRCGWCDRYRRSGGGLLDVDLCNPWNVYKVFRSNACSSFP